MTKQEITKQLIKRLARLADTDSWAGDLNPAQRMALDYLAQANRFSRRPSHVAEFLGSTRGTVSQTLKSLVSKGYVNETKSDIDRRSISYELTKLGYKQAKLGDSLARALESVSCEEIAIALQKVLDIAIANNDQKPFGQCYKCEHFQSQDFGGFCQLLNLNLQKEDTTRICYEQSSIGLRCK